MPKPSYTSSVFINCPFDDDYDHFLSAIIFAVLDCGYFPRCAKEEDDGGNVRFDKIQNIIKECKFGIHDISRTELDKKTKLPRFNMPFELGIFFGAKRFGAGNQKRKKILILDKEKYRYQMYLSDIAGCDIREHENDIEKVISRIRNWLNNATSNRIIPGRATIVRRYGKFRKDLPLICEISEIDESEMTYSDYVDFIKEWLTINT